MNRVRVARILSMEKYQSLRVRLGIITLKNILSYYCLHQSLNDHLAMMILVLVSRFANEIESKDSPFNESTVIQYDSSLVDLISKLKKTIFDQKNSQEHIEQKIIHHLYQCWLKHKSTRRKLKNERWHYESIQKCNF